MIFSLVNMYIWDETADDVNSPITYLRLRPCTHVPPHHESRRKKRSLERADNIVAEEDFIIEFPLEGLEKLTVNETTDDRCGMLYHQFNLSEIDPAPILLTFEPEMPGLVMYANLKEAPTYQNHKWSSYGNETLYLVSEELEDNGGLLWIAVGHAGGLKRIAPYIA
jgi:hypothetical protein